MSNQVRKIRVLGVFGAVLGLIPLLAGCHHVGAAGDNPPAAGTSGSATAAGPAAAGRSPAEMFSHMKKPHS